MLRLLTPYKKASLRLFQELVHQLLLRGGEAHMRGVVGWCCHFDDLPDQRFLLVELQIEDSEEALSEMVTRLPQLEREVVLSLNQSTPIYRLWGQRGIDHEEKILAVQERISALIRRHPRETAAEMISEMHYFLAAFREDFTMARDPRHLTRIIATAYLFRRRSRQQSHEIRRRGIISRVFQAVTSVEGEDRNVLVAMVGICPLRRQEAFDEGHLLMAIRSILPQAHAVAGSFLYRGGRPGGLKTLYVEVVPEEGEWTPQEMQRLRSELPACCRQAIEYVVHPLFMPRNEEEVMRNIITLGRELRYVSDLPQVNITFDQQQGAELIFTVIVAHVVRTEGIDLPGLLQRSGDLCTWSIERQRTIGTLRKRYTKEATVLRVSLPSEPFLRHDHSLDLTKVREAIVIDLERRIGAFRDFNGGLIQQQQVILQGLKTAMGGLTQPQELLLDAFFHGIYPGERRALLHAATVVQWFRSLLALLDAVGGVPEDLQLRYGSIGEGCWGLALMPEALDEEPFQEIQRMMDVERECVFLAAQGPAWRVRGFLCLASDPELRQTLQKSCVRRSFSVQEA